MLHMGHDSFTCDVTPTCSVRLTSDIAHVTYSITLNIFYIKSTWDMTRLHVTWLICIVRDSQVIWLLWYTTCDIKCDIKRYVLWHKTLYLMCYLTCESHTVSMSGEFHTICMSCIDTVCNYIYSAWLYISVLSHTYMYKYIYSVWLYVWVVSVYVWLTQSHTMYTNVHCIYELWATHYIYEYTSDLTHVIYNMTLNICHIQLTHTWHNACASH